MFTATMEYKLLPEKLSEFVEIWENDVYNLAINQSGFVFIQLLVKRPQTAVAIGMWESKEYAEKFMQTGVFKLLMEKVSSLLENPPQPNIWEIVKMKQSDIL